MTALKKQEGFLRSAMNRPGGAWPGWAAVLAVLLAQGALAASPIPAFPKNGTLTVQEVPDRFDKLRKLLRDHRSPAGAKYHVAVVAFSDPHDRQGPAFGDESGAYLDGVVEAWRQSADTENGVILLLGLRNREVRIHPFSRWVRLGWEGYQVVKTVNAARFRSFADAGDYDTGMKELVLAIDAELARRLKAEADAVQRHKDLIARAHAEILSFESRVRQPRYVPPHVRQAHALAVASVAAAQGALAEGDSRNGSELAERAILETDKAARLLTGFEALEVAQRERWRSLQAQAAVLEQTVEAVPFKVTRVRSHLGSARLALQEAQTLLESHSPEEAAAPLTKAATSLDAAEQCLDSARAVHDFQTRTLPSTVAWAAALALLAWLVRLRRRSVLRQREARELLLQWETSLGQVAGNLLRLVEEHALFLGRADLVAHFDGATAGPVREAAREVDNLFLGYDAAQRVLCAAKQELPQLKPFSWFRERPYARAIARLTEQEVVARTEDVTEGKLFLPERREVRMAPKLLLSEMQSSWARALGLVEQLETRCRAAWEELDRLKGEFGILEALQGRLAGLGVSSEGRNATAELGQRLLALHERARRDPLGAEQESKGLAPSVSELITRTRRRVELSSHLQAEVR